MSYLQRLARETSARFQPRRARVFAPQNTLRVEETFVEAPEPARAPQQAPAGQAEAQRTVTLRAAPPTVDGDKASVPGTTAAAPVAPAIARAEHPHEAKLVETVRAAQPPQQPVAMEVRRQLPDAIEESVVFDAREIRHAPSPAEARAAPSQRTEREAPDAKQAESVLARVRALTGRKEFGRQGTAADVEPAHAQEPAHGQRPVYAQVDAVSERRPSESMPQQTRARVIRAADSLAGTVEPIQEPRAGRPLADIRAGSSPRTGNAQFDAKREIDREIVQLSTGSVIVHVEPEAAPPAAQPAARQRPAGNASADAQAADSRWMRSFLDRN